jgi:hypothetical protein
MTEYVTVTRHTSTKVSEKSASVFRVEKSARTSKTAMLVYQTIWHLSQKIVSFKILRVAVADKLITNQEVITLT